jgi:hypothetical protein
MEQPRPADVILYPVSPRSGWTSRFVAAAELMVGAGRGLVGYSHAAILEEGGYQYEAKWPKTGCYHIDRSRPYEVWRIGSPTEDQRHRILAWCRTHEGEWYNMIGLLSGGFLGLPRTAVCSQFAGLAYAAAGIRIGKEGQRLLSPNAIADHPHARCIYRYTPGGKQ